MEVRDPSFVEHPSGLEVGIALLLTGNVVLGPLIASGMHDRGDLPAVGKAGR